jgi:hypothetical protein
VLTWLFLSNCYFGFDGEWKSGGFTLLLCLKAS